MYFPLLVDVVRAGSDNVVSLLLYMHFSSDLSKLLADFNVPLFASADTYRHPWL
jgi:hypothetical protein